MNFRRAIPEVLALKYDKVSHSKYKQDRFVLLCNVGHLKELN